MSKDNHLSMLDANQVIQEVHNESERALDVITANSLVPARFGKVELDYIASGNGMCQVGEARYYSNGVYQEQTIVVHGDALGSAHKTILNFYNRNPQNLANKYFTIYDFSGPVTVWFNLDNSNIMPETGNRGIEINISNMDTEKDLADKLASLINSDSSFFCVVADLMVMVSNRTVGYRPDSIDNNSGLVFKNIQGSNKVRLDGTYFTLNSGANADLYYVWYNVDNSSIDPTVSGRVGIEVNIVSGDDEITVANNTGLAIAQTTKFITNTNENKLTIINRTIGVTASIVDVTCKFPAVVMNTPGADRELVAVLVMEYDTNNSLVSVERL